MKYPYMVLNVPECAGDEEIRQAYLAALQKYTPEREPEKFQEVAEAYKAIATEHARARLRILGMPWRSEDHDLKLDELFPDGEHRRRRPGVQFWKKLLAGGKDA